MAERNLKYGDGRDALLAATVAVVAAKGLQGLTFRAVAEEAGVNNTLISHYFGTKKSLLKAALEWATARSIRLSDLSGAERVDAGFVESLVRLVAEEPELQLFQYEMILASRRDPELRPGAVALYDGYIAALERALGRHGHADAAALARAVFAALDGLVLQRLTVAEEGPITEAMLRIGALLELDHAATGRPAASA